MENGEIFTDVIYDNVENRYEKKEAVIPIITQNTYKIEETKKPDISEIDNKEIISERLRFLKKNIVTELEIGILFTILIFTSLMTLYEILKTSIIKQMMYGFFIVVGVIAFVYLIIVEYRIHKVKNSVKQ